MTLINEQEKYIQTENAEFPYSPDEEERKIFDLLQGLNVEVVNMPGVGYFIQNKDVPYIAEAPVAAFDFDDTSGQTSQDKKQCHQELQTLGLSSAVIKLCDEISRVYVGDTEPTYQVLLEKSLISYALNPPDRNQITSEEVLLQRLRAIRAELVQNKNFDAYPVDSRVEDIYQRTRYTVQFYMDIEQTLRLLRNHERPYNTVMLTYGEPVFQLTKVLPLLRSGLITQVWLTKVRKGTYFKTLLETNPFKNIDLQYTYQETERGVGVKFKEWWIPIILFDDDAKQVESFMRMAAIEGIPLQGVTRVRRPGAKRADQPTQLYGPMTAEITPIIFEGDQAADMTFFTAVLKRLMWNASYTFVKQELLAKGIGALEAYWEIIESLAEEVAMDPEALKAQLLAETDQQVTIAE
jgi:hypothetical protein